MKKRLIISIDGGGIRGVIPLVLLRELQLLLSKNLHDYHPEWWGTSTGAVISAGLNVQSDDLFIHRIQTVLDLYEFRSGAATNPFGTENPARAFNHLIDHNFGAFNMTDVPTVNIVATRLDTLSAHVFNQKNPAGLAESVRASCAVPTLFPSVTIGGLEFVDGFVVAKNPAQLAVQEKELNQELVVLSLGCGLLRVQDEVELEVKKTHESMMELAAQTSMHYFRFDPRLIHAQDGMQNAHPSNIFHLKKDAMAYLFEVHDELKKLVEVLDGGY